MGQRTAFLIKRTYWNGKVNVRLIHHQWGIGRVMHNNFMRAFMEMVTYRGFEEKTLKEIAEITDTNLNTVKSRLYAACKKLGKELEKEDEELLTRYGKSLKKAERESRNEA